MITTKVVTTDFPAGTRFKRDTLLWTTSLLGIMPVLFISNEGNGFRVHTQSGTMVTDNLFESATNAGDYFLQEQSQSLFDSLNHIQQAEYTAMAYLRAIEKRLLSKQGEQE